MGIGGRGLQKDMPVHEAAFCLLLLKEILVSDELSSIYITTVNKEKYRCSLPSISENSDKVSIFVIIGPMFYVLSRKKLFHNREKACILVI